MKLIVLSLVIVTFLVSCAATRTVYVRVPLPIPVKPKLVTITGAELACLSDNVFMKLVERGIQRNKFEARLLAIMETTHKKSSD